MIVGMVVFKDYWDRELKQQLSDAEQEKLLLEKKIQALTELEAVISTRKEQ